MFDMNNQLARDNIPNPLYDYFLRQPHIPFQQENPRMIDQTARTTQNVASRLECSNTQTGETIISVTSQDTNQRVIEEMTMIFHDKLLIGGHLRQQNLEEIRFDPIEEIRQEDDENKRLARVLFFTANKVCELIECIEKQHFGRNPNSPPVEVDLAPNIAPTINATQQPIEVAKRKLNEQSVSAQQFLLMILFSIIMVNGFSQVVNF